MKNKIESILFQHPKTAFSFSVLILLFSLIGLKNLTLDYGVRIWFGKEDALIKDFDKFLDVFGSDNNVVVALEKKDSIFENKTIQHIFEITDGLRKQHQVIRVDSLTTFSDMHFFQEDGIDIFPIFEVGRQYSKIELKDIEKKALNNDLIAKQLISIDGKATSFIIKLGPPEKKQITYRKSLNQIKNFLNQYKKFDYDFKIVGTPPVVDQLRLIGEHDLLLIIPILLLIIGILLFYIFRNISSIFLTFTIISFTILSTIGISGWLHIKLNNLSSMVPGVLIAICIADAIHFLTTIYLKSSNNNENLTYSFQKNFKGTFLTSLTTSLGFLSLTSSSLIPIQNFGLLCAIGTFLAWVFSILIIFPTLKLFPTNSPKPHQLTIKENNKIDFSFLSKVSVNHSKKIILLFSLSTLALLYFASRNTVDSNPFNYLNKKLKINQDNNFLNKKFGGFSNFEIMVDSGKQNGIFEPKFLNKVDQLQNWMKETNHSSYVVSAANYIKRLNYYFNNLDKNFYQIPKSSKKSAEYFLYYGLNLEPGQDFNHMVSIDSRKLRITNFWNIQNSQRVVNLTNRLKDKAQQLGLDITITGREYLFNRMNKHVVHSYFYSIGLSILFIAGILIFVFKSIKIGLLSLIPNLVPIIWGAGFINLLNKPIDVGIVLVASVCFGIAVDDTIHFLLDLSKKKEKNIPITELYNEIFKETGKALIFTTFILVISFLVFLLADFIPNYNFGLLTAFILTIALITDLILLPAVIFQFKLVKKNEN